MKLDALNAQVYKTTFNFVLRSLEAKISKFQNQKFEEFQKCPLKYFLLLYIFWNSLYIQLRAPDFENLNCVL